MVIVLLLFFALFFPSALMGREYLLVYDPFNYSYPLRTIAWESIRHFQWPTWTPLILSGYPLLSMAQLGVGYPFTWGYLFLPGYIAEQVYVLAPFLLSSIFTYFYGREIRLGRVAAVLSGLGFAYGGMMSGSLSNGLLPNAVMWTPLILIAIERSRRGSWARCWIAASLAYAMSILTGVGQGFLYVGVVAGLYSFWISVFPPQTDDEGIGVAFIDRWRPLTAGCGALAAGAGLASFQIMETAVAAGLSVRARLSYETFLGATYSPRTGILATLAPPYYCLESTPFLAPLILILALIAVLEMITRLFARARPNSRVVFWSLLAALTAIFMLGDATPLNRWFYRVPGVNWFRGVSRHSFEWTLAVSILAGFGWEIIKARFGARGWMRNHGLGRILGCLALAASGILAWRWYAWAEGKFGRFDTEHQYFLFKLGVTALLFVALWIAFQLREDWFKDSLILLTVFLACYSEPYILKAKWWGRIASLPPARFHAIPAASDWLRQFPPKNNRVYIRARLFADQPSLQPALDPPNLTALRGLQNVAGYEPLILKRYQQALGNLWLDGVTSLSGDPMPAGVWGNHSRVLDLLNVTYLASYSNWETAPLQIFDREGVKYRSADLGIKLLSSGAVSLFPADKLEADTLAIVSSLAGSAGISNETPIARVRLHSPEGDFVQCELRAGLDTAEWAYESPDVKPAMRHGLASIFDRFPVEKPNRFFSYNYVGKLSFERPIEVARVEIEKLDGPATINIFKASLYDSQTHESRPLLPENKRVTELLKSDDHWRTILEQGGVIIAQNQRALPRAWMVNAVEQVDEAEALRRIQGETAMDFQKAALIETAPPPGLIAADREAPTGTVRLTNYEPARVVLETDSPKPEFLVLSEIDYPGWIAEVDGIPQPIYKTNYLLRGVALEAGRHRVEMRYTAPAARKGALISLLTMILMGVALHRSGPSWRGNRFNR